MKKMKNWITNNNIRRCEMHECLRNVMRLSRWAGFFPVEGLDKSSTTALKFQLKSVYIIYCIATLVGQTVAVGFALFFVFTEPVQLSNFATTLFYVTGFISSFFLLKLAQIWPNLISKAAEIESSLMDIRIKRIVEIKCNAIAYVIVFSGVVEHALCIMFNYKVIMSCMEETTLTLPVVENVLVFRLIFIFKYVSFNFWKGIFMKIVDIQTTFMWTFLDVVISCVSVYITAYFNELNKAINSQKNKTGKAWERFRQNYSYLVALVKKIDSRMSHCVLLCFFTDLVFICIHLFYALNQKSALDVTDCEEHSLAVALRSPIHFYYYIFSFIFLFARVLFMSLLSANVNSVAHGPIAALGEVPASVYNISVERFYRQINYNTIAISGIFFKVTRKMILKVIGTIITYELVLLQFNHGARSDAVKQTHDEVKDPLNDTFSYL